MKDFIKKNKFFTVLLSLVVIVTISLIVYDVQKWYRASFEETLQPEVSPPPSVSDASAITSFTGSYQRSQSGNLIDVKWNYEEGKDAVEHVYLTLNDGNPIDVTSNRYYEFVQSVFAYPTGENKLKLSLVLESGEVLDKEITVFVDYLISAKQSATRSGACIDIQLEYVYDEARPVEIPQILITNISNSFSPNVKYINTTKESEEGRIKATTHFQLIWDQEENIAESMNIRWKFNAIQDSYDFTLQKPEEIKQEDEEKQSEEVEKPEMEEAQ